MATLTDHLRRWRRRTSEAVGITRYSWPALNRLDRQLVEILDYRDGFFVEAGANDGFAQSNTYHLEKFWGWRGLLIEPIPELCARCRCERPKSTVVQAALVAPDYQSADIEMNFAGLMSHSERAFADAEARRRHLATGLAQHGVKGTYTVKVPARTLSAILAVEAPGRTIDLLSLDVEGSEVEALAGLDLDRQAPLNILIETRSRPAITRLLGRHYDPPTVLFDGGTHEDLLFRRR